MSENRLNEPGVDLGGNSTQSVVSESSEKPAHWFFRASPFAVSVVYLLFYFIVPNIHYAAAGAVVISTIISLALVIWLTAQAAVMLGDRQKLITWTVISIIAVIPFRLMLAGFMKPIAPWLWMPYVSGLPDLCFIWFAAAMGCLLSFVLRGVNMIPPIAAVMAMVDMWTVLAGGPVQKVMTSENPVARAVTRTMTVRMAAPQPRGAEPMGGAVGFADFLFIAFFVAAMTRFQKEPSVHARTVKSLIAILCVYMLIVFISGWNLPALIPMAIAMITVHWRRFHYDRSELFAMLYAGLFICAIIAVFWFVSRRNSANTGDKTTPDSNVRAIGILKNIAKLSHEQRVIHHA